VKKQLRTSGRCALFFETLAGKQKKTKARKMIGPLARFCSYILSWFLATLS
jgi:hypothetical protein